MVYCGRPSGGCYACRERKSRCDKLPEGCTQCRKAKRECPGYRKLGDVIFHNENEKVVRKAKAKEARNKAKRDASRVPRSPLVEVQGADSAPIAPELERRQVALAAVEDQYFDVVRHFQSSPSDLILLPPLDDIANGYFVSNFVTRARGEYTGPGCFDYLADIYRENSTDVGLLTSMRAVGLARYAHTSKSSLLFQKARLHYTQAIQHTNRSLRCPEGAKKDSTLLSILVLGIFETITGCQQRSLQDWAQHVNGAAAVVALRGPSQVQSTTGRRMLFQVASNLEIICLVRGQPLPEFIYKITCHAVEKVPISDPGLEVQRVMMDVTQLRANVLAGTLQDPQTILDAAVRLDCSLLALVENAPPSWRYQTVYTDVNSSYIYNGKYHVYSDCSTAHHWNMLRIMRVMLNEMIRDVLLKGFAVKPPIFPFAIHTAQFQLATDTLYKLQLDILSSAPQHLFSIAPAVAAAHSGAEPSPEVTDQGNATQKDEYPSIAPAGHQFELPIRQSQQKEESGTAKIDHHVAMQLRLAQQREEHTAAMIDNHTEQQLRQIPDPPNTSPSLETPFISNSPSTFRQTYGGNFLVWPLWFAGVMDIATDEVHAFVTRNLREIGEGMGIKQGHVLADILERRQVSVGRSI